MLSIRYEYGYPLYQNSLLVVLPKWCGGILGSLGLALSMWDAADQRDKDWLLCNLIIYLKYDRFGSSCRRVLPL